LRPCIFLFSLSLSLSLTLYLFFRWMYVYAHVAECAGSQWCGGWWQRKEPKEADKYDRSRVVVPRCPAIHRCSIAPRITYVFPRISNNPYPRAAWMQIVYNILEELSEITRFHSWTNISAIQEKKTVIAWWVLCDATVSCKIKLIRVALLLIRQVCLVGRWDAIVIFQLSCSPT
jgi:hypothetical protein